LQNGTATGGSDFQALGTGLLSFTAGQTSRTITFTIFPDQISEPVETFRAVLSEQSTGVIGIGPVDTATISIVDQPGETYATWAATKFTAAQLNNPAISGKEANPDNDALPNVLEYAFDGDPLSASSAPLPASTFETVEGEDIVRHALMFPRRKQSLDLTYTVQRTTDIGVWQDGAVLSPTGMSNFPGIVQLVSATGGPIETRTVRDAVALNDGQRAWLRVHVTCQ
jgi:alpha-N-arabinofuranosidase